MKLDMSEPTIHRPIPLQTRVILPEYLGNLTGKVAGIYLMGPIFHYIVILDKPLNNEFGENNAISISGTELRSEVTGLKWLLDFSN